MVAIIVEDGSGVADANSWNSVQDFKDYAEAHGYTVPNDDTTIEVNLIRSTDNLQSRRSQFKGRKTNTTQRLCWPRSYAEIEPYAADAVIQDDGYWTYDPYNLQSSFCKPNYFPANQIPEDLKSAQCELVNALNSGIDLRPTQTGQFIKSEKIDVIETVYSESVKVDGQPFIPIVEDFLASLISSGGVMSLTVKRA